MCQPLINIACTELMCSYTPCKNTTHAKFQISIVELMLGKAFQSGFSIISNFAACPGKQRVLHYNSTVPFTNAHAYNNIEALSGRTFPGLIFQEEWLLFRQEELCKATMASSYDTKHKLIFFFNNNDLLGDAQKFLNKSFFVEHTRQSSHSLSFKISHF